mgnify:FL=1
MSLKKHCDALVLRNDLTPANIYLCSTEVLKSFKETYEFNVSVEAYLEHDGFRQWHANLRNL